MQYLFLALSLFSAFFSASAKAEVKRNTDSQINSISRISQLSEFPKPATTIKEWLSQSPASPSPSLVTGVRINETKEGIEIILNTPDAKKLQPTSRSEGNRLIVDIPNAQLRYSDANAFRQEKPIAGIAEVSVINSDTNNVRLIVTGETALPNVELFDSDESLIFGVTQKLQQAEAEPIELIVTGEQDSYKVDTTTTGTRTDTPLRDVPQAIQVIPRQVLEDQQVERLNDALRNSPSVVPDNSVRSAFEGFTIRGFSNRNIIRNGLRDDTSITTNILTENIEQIEVLRGPASVIFGSGGAGGTVNVVTKKPLSTPFYSIEGTIGNFNTYGGSIDLTGPLNNDKTLLYRLNAGVLSTDTFVDFFDRETYFVAPSWTWMIGKDTQFTVETEYSDQRQPNDRGLPALGTILSNPNGKIPINRFIGEPSIDQNNRRTFRLGYNFEHRLSQDWQLRNAFNFSYLSVQQNSVFPDTLLEDNRTLTRGLVIAKFAQQTYNIDTNIVGNFKTGSIDHKLLIGIDLSRDRSFQEGRTFFQELAPIDLFNPVYSRENVGAPLEEISDEPSQSDGLGIYLQDQITFSDNFKLVLGGRFDIVNQKLESQGETTSFQQDEAFSPRIGFVYQPSKQVSVYANYSRSFQQVTGSNLDNRLFEPERGTQYEVGVKLDWTQRLSSTFALYQITRSNVLTTDPRDPNFSIQTGEQRSRGLELDITGEILPGWKIIAGYAYTDAIVSEDNTIPEGNRINNVPEHAFNFWSTYEIQKGSLQGLGFGLGLFYIGERQGDLDNTFTLPSYVRTDAALFYRQNNFRAALNLQNLFDTNYFEAGESTLRVFPGAPRTVKFTLGWQF